MAVDWLVVDDWLVVVELALLLVSAVTVTVCVLVVREVVWAVRVVVGSAPTAVTVTVSTTSMAAEISEVGADTTGETKTVVVDEVSTSPLEGEAPFRYTVWPLMTT